jgi:hypothetical protein
MYLLVREINTELDSFIKSGRTELGEFHVLPESDEQEIVSTWTNLGYEVRYCRHRLEYMGKTVTIKCLKAHNPDSNVSISLIPWFMAPGRLFPIFVYIYAVWYYHQHGKNSLNEAAKACGKLFKIDSFHKSTVSRSIKAMETILGMSQIDKVLSVVDEDISHGIAQSDKSRDESIERITEILKISPSVDSLKKQYQDAMKPLPEAINTKATKVTIEQALSGIPAGHGQMVIRAETSNRASRDMRKRPQRPRRKKRDPVQHRFKFVEYAQREKIRTAFIDKCRHIVLDAAVTYHRFLV